MSKFNESKVKQIFSQYFNITNVDAEINVIKQHIVERVKKFIIDYENIYPIEKIEKTKLLSHSASLQKYISGKKIENDELRVENIEFFELYHNDKAKRRVGSRSLTYNNDKYLLSINKNPYEMSIMSPYAGFTYRGVGRMLFYRSDRDLNVMNILDYNLQLKDRHDIDKVYYKRSDFIVDFVKSIYGNNIYNNLLKLKQFKTERFNQGDGNLVLDLYQRLMYYGFELYNQLRKDNDPIIDGILLFDGNAEPLINKNYDYYFPGTELLVFSPENRLVLESIYYIKDNIMFYDINTWKKYLEEIALPEIIKKGMNETKPYSFQEFRKINTMLNNYVRRCRYMYMNNDMFNPIISLKNILIYLDTECSCLFIRKLQENISDNKVFKQENVFPLSTAIQKDKRFIGPDQNSAYITQEICINNSSERYSIPEKPEGVIRIMTYNVHFWMGPKRQNDFENKGNDIVMMINSINPDIICLQEVQIDDSIGWNTIKTKFDKNYVVSEKYFCSADWSKFGNMIIYKKDIQFKNYRIIDHIGIQADTEITEGKTSSRKIEKRCAIACDINIYNKNYTIYSVHLEVENEKDRIDLTQKIIEDIKKNRDDNKISIVLGDFNSTRKEQPYKLMNENQMIDSYNFKGIPPPLYTTWTGTEIDFIFLDSSKITKSSVLGTFVVHTPLSDHLPLFIDLKKENETINYNTLIRFVNDLTDLNYDIMTMNEKDLLKIEGINSWYKTIVDKNNLNVNSDIKYNTGIGYDKIINKNSLIDLIDNQKFKNINLNEFPTIMKLMSESKKRLIMKLD